MPGPVRGNREDETLNRRGVIVVGAIVGFSVFGQTGALPAQTADRVSSAGAPHDDQELNPPAAEGTVERFILDPRGEVEGLLLADGTQLYVTSRAEDQVIRAFKPGDRVRVYGRLKADERLVQPDVIKNLTRGTTFTVPLRLDLPMQEQARRLSVTEMNATGTIRLVFYHPLKRIVQGMILSDDTQIRLPPDTSPELRESFHVGDVLTIRGNGTANQFGRAIEAVAIGRDSTSLVPLDASLQRLP